MVYIRPLDEMVRCWLGRVWRKSDLLIPSMKGIVHHGIGLVFCRLAGMWSTTQGLSASRVEVVRRLEDRYMSFLSK